MSPAIVIALLRFSESLVLATAPFVFLPKVKPPTPLEKFQLAKLGTSSKFAEAEVKLCKVTAPVVLSETPELLTVSESTLNVIELLEVVMSTATLPTEVV
jgi:hypothetical protein